MTGLTAITNAIAHLSSDTPDAISETRAPDDLTFSGFFRSMVEQTSAADSAALQQVSGPLNGSGAEVHDAMIAMQKADLAFELALQVRNKAVGAYQQMISMQF